MIWTKLNITHIFILPYLFTSLTANLPNAHDPAMFYTKLPRKWKEREPKCLRWWYNYLLYIMIYRALLNTVTVINHKSKQTSSALWITITDLRFASDWRGERHNCFQTIAKYSNVKQFKSWTSFDFIKSPFCSTVMERERELSI